MGPFKKYRYSEEAMEAAIKDVENGVSKRLASKVHGVPRSTLCDKVLGKTQKERKIGRDPYLTLDEEKLLVDWLTVMKNFGFPISVPALCDSVQKILLAMDRSTPFPDGRPGRKWVSLFFKRHPTLTKRKPQNLTSSRASVSTIEIKEWFSYIENQLTKDGIFEIITTDGSRVFNADETAIFLNPQGNKIISPKGHKSVHQTIGADEKDCLTVLIVANAIGQIAPPGIIFKYKHLPRTISDSLPLSWGAGKTDSGWMTAESFYEYMANIFEPWLTQNNIIRPVIFFVDGHASHVTMHISDFCRSKQIVLVALLPNATHILQPLDVSFFKPLKSAWKRVVYEYRLERVQQDLSTVVRKENFAPLLKKSIDSISPEVISAGFKKTGIFPWCPLSLSNSNIAENTPPKFRNEEVSTLEKMIGLQKLETFKACTEEHWTGDPVDTSLFTLWKEAAFTKESAFEKKGIHNKDLLPTSNREENNNVDTCTTSLSAGDCSDPLEGTSKMNNSDSLFIPSPFKKALFWPGQTNPNPSRRRKIKTPSFITSDAWRDFHMKKEKLKLDKENEKQKRAAARLLKKQQKKRELPKISTFIPDDSDDDDPLPLLPDSSDDDYDQSQETVDEVDLEIPSDENIKSGSFVLVSFLRGKRHSVSYRYLCSVQSIDGTDIEVLGLKAVDTSKRCFITVDKDISTISREQILGILPSPKIEIIGERIRFVFEKAIDVFEQ